MEYSVSAACHTSTLVCDQPRLGDLQMNRSTGICIHMYRTVLIRPARDRVHACIRRSIAFIYADDLIQIPYYSSHTLQPICVPPSLFNPQRPAAGLPKAVRAVSRSKKSGSSNGKSLPSALKQGIPPAAIPRLRRLAPVTRPSLLQPDSASVRRRAVFLPVQ